MSEPAPQKPLSVVESLSLGLRVWAREMRALSRTALLRLEQGRIEKRLTREYERLGRLAAASRGSATNADWEASLKQIDFLKEEVETLAQEAKARREARAARPQAQASAPETLDE
jgi:hypothetical protein